MEEKVIISITLVDVYHQLGLGMEEERLGFPGTERRGGRDCSRRR